MALSRAYASAKVADVAKMRPLNRRWVAHPPVRSMAVPHLTATVVLNPNVLPDYHLNLIVSSEGPVPPFLSIEFCRNRLSSFCVTLLTNKQTN